MTGPVYYKITPERLQDIKNSFISFSAWKHFMERSDMYGFDAKMIMDHPIIKEFNFFTTSPTGLYFYVDNDTVQMDTYLVAHKKLDDKLVINPRRDTLYNIYEKNGELFIRIGTASHDRVL